MCGGRSEPIPPPTEDFCPIQVNEEIKDILHSGNKQIWDEQIFEGTYLELEPDPNDLTISVLFEGSVIGRIYNQLIYKCITKNKYTYTAVLVNKKDRIIRLRR